MGSSLLSTFQLGDIELRNRMIMAPMTRNRAGEGEAPTDLNAMYYRQRAGAGLIITEASQVAPEGIGYPATPGIHSPEQVMGWQKITRAVHEEGGRIFIQLWFCGRISHPSLLPDNATPVAPSAIRPAGQAFTTSGMQDFVTPRALTIAEINSIVDQYRHAAHMASEAGFDGVEVHAANGYLIDQFLRDGSNQRDDEYGGSVENRMRFLNQVLDAVLEVWPSQRVGIRLTPENSFNDMSDSNPTDHFLYFIAQLNNRNLAYLHMLEGDMGGADRALDYRVFRDAFNGPYIANNGYTQESGEQSLANGDADLIAYGIPYLANPDLVERFRSGAGLNEPNFDRLYGGGPDGYTDYPTLG